MDILIRLRADSENLRSFLIGQHEVSLATFADDSLRKTLILASASYFEDRIKFIIESFAAKVAGADHPMVSLVKAKVIERQYHTYFDWSGRNANRFFGMFGERLKSKMVEVAKRDTEVVKGTEAFLELGELRNRLVHQNFAAFEVEKTVEEIFELAESAHRFV